MKEACDSICLCFLRHHGIQALSTKQSKERRTLFMRTMQEVSEIIAELCEKVALSIPTEQNRSDPLWFLCQRRRRFGLGH